ncbi:putative NAD(P)H quinone oxidoreductase, PIG3 family [Alkalibacterium subtropicum]|uniref:Putative NAD(P)H quinone oxidoreductase, PIG3 family n=1 Tax=Alkalibacterium subtropicum TaxID=753702 RepID=A0A1I1FJK7_9LACT|nr:NAD(P)H-quinone oxidoreductase [Alkalibacterium subtropicum]SFB99172.1 putative NAD(P)H quinone oxidoreductase, PIG3 family [Alkalibacterium subtropicum]
MRAWSIEKPGGRQVLQQIEVEKPVPKQGELLVEVKAAGINRTDTLTRQNTALTEPYPILGVEVSGVVVENQSTDSKLHAGTRVCGLVNHGGYGEYVTMPDERAIVLPDELTFEEGAAIPEVFLTAYQTMYWLGELKEKEKILIHAAGSGVGTAAIQMASQLSQATIFATAGHPEKLEKAKELGAHVLVNYKEESFAERISGVTEGIGVDVILDFVGGSYWKMNLESCAVDARWILIGTLGGSEVDKVSLGDVMKKRIVLKGTLLTPRSDDYKAQLSQEFAEVVMPFFKEKKLKPVIHVVIPFEELPEAHRMMEDNENTGKIIMKVSD